MYIWDQVDLIEDGDEKESARAAVVKSPRTGVLHQQNSKKNAAYESVTAQFHRQTRSTAFVFPSSDMEEPDEDQSTLFGDIRSAISKHDGSLSARSTGSIISSLAHETEIEMDDISDFSHPLRRLNRFSRGGISAHENNDLALLTKQIEEKLTAMKEELHSRDASAKELQLELQRLQAATERRRAKEVRNWESQAQATREEHADSLKKLRAFCDKLQSECSQLRDKRQALLNSLESHHPIHRADALGELATVSGIHQSKGPQKRQLALEKARSEASSRVQQARRQLESDEKAALGKVAASRADSMKKSIEETIFAPRLESMVAEGKRKANEMREKAEVRLAELKRELQGDNFRQIEEQRKKQQEELAQAVERARRVGERQLEEQRAKHEREIGQVKERERQVRETMQQSADTQRQAETDTHQEALRALAKREAAFAQDMMSALALLHVIAVVPLSQERHQKEVGDLLSSNSISLEQLRQQLRDEAHHREEQSRASRQRQILEHRQRKREQSMRALQTETAAILSKIREEAAEKRRNIRTRSDEEIATLTQQTAAASERLKQLHKIVGGELRPRLAGLREELKTVEHEFSDMEESHAKAVSQRQADLTQQVLSLQRKESQLREQRLSQEKAWEDRKTVAVSEYQDEIGRIKDKIFALMRKKRNMLQDLRDSLQNVKGQNAELEQRLEQLRHSVHDI
eukprot:gene23860-30960_t